jgi:A/G-specific adenine glycosylase
MISPFQDKLLRWYGRNARNLPWRKTRDPYRIWVSEVMLQQTRVAAAIPYFERFIERFPDVGSLARAPEEELLRAWSGLGYYSRARNLRQAAKLIAARGSFPNEYAALRELPGIGQYTAAAVASIAFNQPYAVVDANVRRVLSRVACRNEGLDEMAGALLDRKHPGRYNQALMELGAMVCLPREPHCAGCPVAALCTAKRHGRQNEFPARKPRPAVIQVARQLLRVVRKGRLLLWKRQGFWELPEAAQLPAAVTGGKLCEFRHSITNHRYIFALFPATVRRVPPGFKWFPLAELSRIPLSTIARKALQYKGTGGLPHSSTGKMGEA